MKSQNNFKLLVITNLLPHYQVIFFNRLVEKYPDINLTVVADIQTTDPLNNYDRNVVKFAVVHNAMNHYKGLIFRNDVNKIINNIKPDKLIIYANPREISLFLLMFKLRIAKSDFFIHGMFHRIGGQTIFSRVFYKASSFLAKRVFIYSRKGAEVLLGLGVDYTKIKIVGTAIDQNKSIVNSSKITDADLELFRHANGISGKKVVLQVVRLSEIKKPWLIIDVAKKVMETNPDLIFILIGGGDLLNSMKQMVSDNNLGNTVKLLGPIYDEVTLSYWFKSASVFVMPTCIGLSVHHAFSYGLPVVTDDDLLHQASEFDIISDGLNGKLYKAGSVDAFAESILAIVTNDAYRSMLSFNALKTVTLVHSLDNKVDNYYNGLSS